MVEPIDLRIMQVLVYNKKKKKSKIILKIEIIINLKQNFHTNESHNALKKYYYIMIN